MENQPSNIKNHSTHYGRYIARVVTLNLVVIVVATVYSNITRQRQVKRIEDAAALARVKAEVLEQQLLDYMQRTVQRWDALQELNTTLNVPKASEPQPLGKRELTASELIRKDRPVPPKPTATPRAEVKTKTKVIIKYRRTPTPKPFFHIFE